MSWKTLFAKAANGRERRSLLQWPICLSLAAMLSGRAVLRSPYTLLYKRLVGRGFGKQDVPYSMIIPMYPILPAISHGETIKRSIAHRAEEAILSLQDSSTRK